MLDYAEKGESGTVLGLSSKAGKNIRARLRGGMRRLDLLGVTLGGKSDGLASLASRIHSISYHRMSNSHSSSEGRSAGRGRRRRRRRGGSSLENKQKPVPQASWWSRLAAFFGFGRKGAAGKMAGKPASGVPAGKEARREKQVNGTQPPPSRPFEKLEVNSPRLYVGNLAYEATESDLFELFSGAGKVVNVEVVCSRHTQRSKGFAFVQMQTVEEARRAVEELHDKEYMGRKLLVSGAKPLENRPARNEEQSHPSS